MNEKKYLIEGYEFVECPRCHGTGRVMAGYETIFGATPSTCPECGGEGKIAELEWQMLVNEKEYERIKKVAIHIHDKEE